MRVKFLYLIDQLFFSAFGFVLFLVLDGSFPEADVAEYAVMISGGAFLLNLGFAVMVERLLGEDDRGISFFDFAVLLLIVAVSAALVYFVLWREYVHGVVMGLTLFTTSIVWLVRRICVLDSDYVVRTIIVTSISGSASLLFAWGLSEFQCFLIAHCIFNGCAIVYLSYLSVRSMGVGLGASLVSVVEHPKRLTKSLLLVPLLWFPSNGIYIILSFFSGASVLIEMRKLLMLLSPVQQLSTAMINFIFSKGRRYEVSALELYVLPLMASLAVTPVCAVIYNKFLHGASAQVSLWLAFATIVVCMLVISSLQSALRVRGAQLVVVGVLALVAIVKLICLFMFYSIQGEISLGDGLISMAVAYSVGALVLGASYALKYKSSERARF